MNYLIGGIKCFHRETAFSKRFQIRTLTCFQREDPKQAMFRFVRCPPKALDFAFFAHISPANPYKLFFPSAFAFAHLARALAANFALAAVLTRLPQFEEPLR